MPSEGPSSDNEGSIKNLDDIDRVSGETIRAAAKAPVTCSSFFQARIPILSWLPKYVVMKHLPGDLIAGITVGLMVIPQGLGQDTHTPPHHSSNNTRAHHAWQTRNT